MHYIGYALIALSVLFGYGQMHQLSVVILALLSTVIFARARRKSIEYDWTKPGALLDGAFLLAIQILIMFTGYALGYFFANSVEAVPVAG